MESNNEGRDNIEGTRQVGAARPAGKLIQLADHLELQLSRSFRASIGDVWASVTEPERTARWFGPWEGVGAVGETVRVKMIFEEGADWYDLTITACDAPRRLAVHAADDQGSWKLELRLTEHEDVTDLTLVHLLDSADGIGEIGPGWEYYLDLLVAAFQDHQQPSFDEYYPQQKEYFESLTPE